MTPPRTPLERLPMDGLGALLAALPGAQALNGLSAAVLPGKTPAELAELLAGLAAYGGETALAMKILP